MTTKHFLPTPVLSFDIEEMKDRIIPTIERRAPSHARLPRCLRKFFPIIGIFTMMFGSAFLGFSVSIVDEGKIGYYSPSCIGCDAQIYSPGVYFALPWSKGSFNTINIADRNLTIGTISGMESNGTCIALQHIRNVTEYVSSLILFSNSETRLTSELITVLKKVLSITSFENFTYNAHGTTFTNPYFI